MFCLIPTWKLRAVSCRGNPVSEPRHMKLSGQWDPSKCRPAATRPPSRSIWLSYQNTGLTSLSLSQLWKYAGFPPPHPTHLTVCVKSRDDVYNSPMVNRLRWAPVFQIMRRTPTYRRGCGILRRVSVQSTYRSSWFSLFFLLCTLFVWALSRWCSTQQGRTLRPRLDALSQQRTARLFPSLQSRSSVFLGGCEMLHKLHL